MVVSWLLHPPAEELTRLATFLRCKKTVCSLFVPLWTHYHEHTVLVGIYFQYQFSSKYTCCCCVCICYGCNIPAHLLVDPTYPQSAFLYALYVHVITALLHVISPTVGTTRTIVTMVTTSMTKSSVMTVKYMSTLLDGQEKISKKLKGIEVGRAFKRYCQLVFPSQH